MRISIGVRFLFAKSLICKAFSILFNDIRLCGTPETVAAEPFAFSPITPFNERSRGVQILVGGVHFRQKGCAHFNYPQERKRKAAKSVHPKIRTTLRPCILFSDLDLRAVAENEGYLADFVEKHSFSVTVFILGKFVHLTLVYNTNRSNKRNNSKKGK